ncbi:hypothetical protein [Chitinophaga oryzae]|nr:hypothetical protein [Chitinophaga oryzae]
MGQYEIVLLPWNSRSWLETMKIRRISSLLRQSSPICFILLYRSSLCLISDLLRMIMPISNNFTFSKSIQPTAFSVLVQKLFLRWQQQFELIEAAIQHRKTRPIKGVVAVGYAAGELIKLSLSKLSIHVTLTEVSVNFEKQFLHELPDFVLLHCHNRKGDSDIVMAATHTIRRLHPRCLIYVTCSSAAWPHFIDRYRLLEFSFDELLLTPFTTEELQGMLFRDLFTRRRYHLPPTHS